MNWTVYSKTTGEVLEHRKWPRGEPMLLPDNFAARHGHIDRSRFIIIDGRLVESDQFDDLASDGEELPLGDTEDIISP